MHKHALFDVGVQISFFLSINWLHLHANSELPLYVRENKSYPGILIMWRAQSNTRWVLLYIFSPFFFSFLNIGQFSLFDELMISLQPKL